MILSRAGRKAFLGGRLEGGEWWRPWWDLDRLPQWLSVSYGSLHPSHTVRVCSSSTSTWKTSEEPPVTSGILRNKTRDSRFSRQLLWGTAGTPITHQRKSWNWPRPVIRSCPGESWKDASGVRYGGAGPSVCFSWQNWCQDVPPDIDGAEGCWAARGPDLFSALCLEGTSGKGTAWLWLPCPHLQPAWRQGAELWQCLRYKVKCWRFVGSNACVPLGCSLTALPTASCVCEIHRQWLHCVERHFLL